MLGAGQRVPRCSRAKCSGLWSIGPQRSYYIQLLSGITRVPLKLYGTGRRLLDSCWPPVLGKEVLASLGNCSGPK